MCICNIFDNYAHRHFTPTELTDIRDRSAAILNANMAIKGVLVLSAANIDDKHWVLVAMDPATKTIWYTIHTRYSQIYSYIVYNVQVV